MSSSFKYSGLTRMLVVAGAVALVATGCAAPGTEGTASGDPCEKSAALDIAALVADMSPADREAALFEAAMATEDGQIDLYTEINDPQPIVDGFEEKHDGLTVNVYRAGSEQIRQRVVEESAAMFSGADLVEMDTLEVAILDSEGLLSPAHSPLRAELSAAAQFDNYIGDRLSYIVPAWNSDLLTTEEIPQSLEDFADPRFKGLLALEGSDVFWFAGMVTHLESEGMTRDEAVGVFNNIAANASITSGHTTTTELVVAGQYAIAINNYVHRVLEIQGKGAPLAYSPVNIPVVAEITAVTVPCLSDNPAGAVLLQDFFLSADGGQAIFVADDRTPSNVSMATETFGGEQITPIEVNVADVAANYAEWATLWDEVIKNGSQG